MAIETKTFCDLCKKELMNYANPEIFYAYGFKIKFSLSRFFKGSRTTKITPDDITDKIVCDNCHEKILEYLLIRPEICITENKGVTE